MHVQEDVTSPGAEQLAAVSCLTWALRPQLVLLQEQYVLSTSQTLVQPLFWPLFQMRIQPPVASVLFFYCLKIIISPTPTPDVCLFCLIDYQIISLSLDF